MFIMIDVQFYVMIAEVGSNQKLKWQSWKFLNFKNYCCVSLVIIQDKSKNCCFSFHGVQFLFCLDFSL